MQKFYNKTRQSSSIPRKLMNEGHWYLLPVYYFLITSELAHEGIKNSGSYNFADHIYENKPKGKFFVGKMLDYVLLNLESAKSLRARYIHAKKEIYNLIKTVSHQEPIDILAVPCGLSREFFEVARELEKNNILHNRIHWYGIDLDEKLVETLKEKSEKLGYKMQFMVGDALNQETYHLKKDYDMIINTGFTEFLDDEKTLCFYKIAYSHLKEGGIFFTSGMMPHKLSEYLMKNIAELHTEYRSEDALKILAQKAGFTKIHTYKDKLQTILLGTR
jgi:2-polyprenyl-3-methyl-5-hydroxy-6-metoxy-1,4-benzoquinol methylase